MVKTFNLRSEVELTKKEESMKKTLIASAVAAATISSASFAMDPASELAARLDSMPTFYGNIQLAYINDNSDEKGYLNDDKSNDFIDNGSTLGFKHSHEIQPGLTGFLKAEMEFGADNTDDSDGLGKLDEAYMGVKGGFGSVQVGSDDTVYEWVDKLDMYEAVGIYGEVSHVAEGDNMQYTSPMIADILTIGATVQLDNTEAHKGALAVKAEFGSAEIVLAYAMGSEETNDDGDTVDTADSIGLAVSFMVGDLELIGQYETKDADEVNGVDDKTTDKDLYGVLAIYGLGASQFALGYKYEEDDAGTETDQVYVQALHNMSYNMYVYVEYVNGTEEMSHGSDNDIELFAVGATYYF